MSIEERMKQFIVENFYIPNPEEIEDETSLIGGGYVDSTGMLELITFLEDEFKISISDKETTPENLETIGRIARFVARKQNAPAS